MNVKDSTRYGWIVISRAEYEKKRYHGYAGTDPDGTVWVVAQDENGATCLYKNVEIVDFPEN